MCFQSITLNTNKKNLLIKYQVNQTNIFLGVLISLSKITAALFFLENYPRKYPPTEFHSLFSFFKNIFLSFFIKPDEKYFNENLTSMFPFGLHEMEYSLSIVPLILLFFVFF